MMSAVESPPATTLAADGDKSDGEMSDDGECSEVAESPAGVVEENDAGELDFEPEDPAESTLKSDPEDKEDGEMEDSDEGQISSDEDETEIKTEVKSQSPPKEVEDGEVDDEDGPTPVYPDEKLRDKSGICKFYARGQCTWGSECKFQHTGASKGNYQMFPDARPIASLIPPGGLGKGKMPPRYPARDKMESTEIPSLIAPLIPRVSGPADDAESAWERGVKQAKELMKKSAVRHEGDGEDSPKKPAIPPLIPADSMEPTGRRPSGYASSDPDRSDAGSNRGSGGRKVVAAPEGEIGPFVNRGGFRDRPNRNDRNASYQNYPNELDDVRKRHHGDYYDRRFEESGDFGDDHHGGRGGDYDRQQPRNYDNQRGSRGNRGNGNFRGGDNLEPPVYPLIGPTGRPDGFYNRGGDNRNRRGGNNNNNQRRNQQQQQHQYRHEREDEGRPLPYELPANRNYDAEWTDPWSRSARPGSRRRTGSSSSGGSRGARRNRSSSSSASNGSSSSGSRSQSSGSSSSSQSAGRAAKIDPIPPVVQPANKAVANRQQPNRPPGQMNQQSVKKIPLPNATPNQSNVKKQKSGGDLSPPPLASNRQASPVPKPLDDRSPIKLTIVNRFQSKVKNVADGHLEGRLTPNSQNKRKPDDLDRKPTSIGGQGGNGKSGGSGGPAKRQKLDKPSGTSSATPDKSTKSRREELLRQLKAVEDAIARKRSKIS